MSPLDQKGCGSSCLRKASQVTGKSTEESDGASFSCFYFLKTILPQVSHEAFAYLSLTRRKSQDPGHPAKWEVWSVIELAFHWQPVRKKNNWYWASQEPPFYSQSNALVVNHLIPFKAFISDSRTIKNISGDNVNLEGIQSTNSNLAKDSHTTIVIMSVTVEADSNVYCLLNSSPYGKSFNIIDNQSIDEFCGAFKSRSWRQY